MDFLTPTPERLEKHTEWETPRSDSRTKRTHHRTVGVVDSMHRRGWLRDEQRQAFLRWEEDLNDAEWVHVPMCRYGRPFYGSNAARDPVDIKIDATKRVREASSGVGHPSMVQALSIAALQECTLESIGRTVAGEGNKTAAIAAGKQLMQIGTYRLALHYQYLRDP